MSSTVVPSGGDLVDERPELVAAAGIETGGRLVEQHHGRPADERGGEVEPAAHAAGVRAGAAVGGVDEVEPLEHLGRARSALAGTEAVEPADELEVLPTRQELVDGRGLTGEPDELPHALRVAGDVDPADRTVPPSGRSSVASARTSVVLPAPFGPSRPTISPAPTRNDTPASAGVGTEGLRERRRPRSSR